MFGHAKKDNRGLAQLGRSRDRIETQRQMEDCHSVHLIDNLEREKFQMFSTA